MCWSSCISHMSEKRAFQIRLHILSQTTRFVVHPCVWRAASRIAIDPRADAPCETIPRTKNSSRRARAVRTTRDAIATSQGRESCR